MALTKPTHRFMNASKVEEPTTPKVLLVSPDFPPPLVGGSLTYIFNLVQHYRGRVDVLAAPASSAEIVDERHRVRRPRALVNSKQPSRPELAASYAYMLFVLPFRIAIGRYDLVVANSGQFGNSLVIVVARLTHVPVCVVAYAEEITIPLHRRGAGPALKRWFLRVLYPKASGFLAVCHFTADQLANLGVGKERIEIVVPMLALDKTDGVAQDKDHRGARVLTVGRLERRKGFRELIEAIARLVDRIPEIELTIVGDGPERPILEQMADRLGVSDRIAFAGRVSDDDLVKLYRQSDVFVLANLFLDDGNVEGAPTVFIEAGAHGLPVIGGISGGTSDVVHNGETGVLVDPSDVAELSEAIARVLQDPDLAAKMGSAGRRKVLADHDPAANGARAEAFLRSLARRRVAR